MKHHGSKAYLNSLKENGTKSITYKSSKNVFKFGLEWRKERVGQNLPLSVTSSGHYTIPITRNQYILEKVRRDVQLWTTLSVSHLSNEDIVNRLHRQFSLPPSKC